MMAQFVGASMLPPPLLPAQPRRPGCAQDWEDNRMSIQRLYCEEKRPLKEVAEVMRNEGFLATYVVAYHNACLSP
jgi:hypothetical protein